MGEGLLFHGQVQEWMNTYSSGVEKWCGGVQKKETLFIFAK